MAAMCPVRSAIAVVLTAALVSPAPAQGGATPLAPGECRVSFTTDRRGDADVAAVTLTYRFQTPSPRSTVSLGGRGTFPATARYATGETPALIAGDEGLSVRVPAAGSYELTVVTECAVVPRQGGGDVGFDLSLPGSVVTTLTATGPAPRTYVVTANGGGAGNETRRFGPGALAATADRPGGVPLGPVTALAVSWDDPTARPFATTTATFDTDVRVEDTVVEGVTRLRVTGNERKWALELPDAAQVEVTRFPAAADGRVERGVSVSKPASPGLPWVVSVPEPGEWLVTVRHRTVRPAKGTPEWLGPYAVGPVTVVGASRQTGTVRLYAPPAVRVVVSHGSELRPADPAPGGGDAPAATFFARTVPASPGDRPAPPLLTFDVRPAPAAVAIRPSHRLRLSDAGWQWRAVVRVIPTHVELTQVVIDVPAGWGGLEAGPADVVDGVQPVPGDGSSRRVTVRLATPRKEAFDLTLDSSYTTPGGPNATTHTIAFPRVVAATERDARVGVSVPDGWTVKGTVADGEGGSALGRSVELVPDAIGKSGAAVTAAAAACDRAALATTLTWHPFRPDLSVHAEADAVFGERQLVVTQSFTFDSPTPYPRPLRLRGPANAAGIRSTPALTPTGPGEYTVAPPADKSRFPLTLTYAVPTPPAAAEPERPVGLFWAEDATDATATVRAWAPPGRRVTGARGPWRETDLTPSPDRDSWPAVCLTATRSGGEPIPALTLDTAEGPNATTDTIVERAELIADLAPDAPHGLIARYWLSRWPAAGVPIDLPPGPAADVFVDGKRVEHRAADAGETFVIPVPESRAGRGFLAVEIRLSKSATPGEFRAPTWPRATNRSDPRWVVLGPPGSVLLDPRPALTPDGVWAWRGLPNGFAFVPREDPDGLRPGSASHVLAGRPSGAGDMVRVVTVPRPIWVVACSFVVLSWGVFGLRRPDWAGRIVLASSLLAAGAYALRPQITAQFLSGAQPGFVVVLVLMAGRAAHRRWLARRERTWPAFSDIDPVTTPVPVGRSGATPAPVRPAGS
jgi:hypothetical protein